MDYEKFGNVPLDYILEKVDIKKIEIFMYAAKLYCLLQFKDKQIVFYEKIFTKDMMTWFD